MTWPETLNGKLCANDCRVLEVALFDGERETAHTRLLLSMNKEVNKLNSAVQHSALNCIALAVNKIRNNVHL